MHYIIKDLELPAGKEINEKRTGSRRNRSSETGSILKKR